MLLPSDNPQTKCLHASAVADTNEGEVRSVDDSSGKGRLRTGPPRETSTMWLAGVCYRIAAPCSATHPRAISGIWTIETGYME